MGSRSLGTLTLDLILRAGAFTAGMTGAERTANKSLSAIEQRAYKFGQTIGTAIRGGAVVATAALTAVAAAVSQAISRADEMRDLSIRTGVATEALSAYAYAAKQTGTDIEGLSRGLKLLAKNATEALDPKSEQFGLFKALGIGVKDAEGNLKNLEDLLPEIADKFKGLEDGTLKAALAQKLFGKSGVELIEFLNQGSAGLSDFAEKAQDLGIIIGSDTAAAADEFKDKLADLKEIANGFANQIAAELLPRLIELVDRLNASAKEGQVLGTSVQDIGSLFDVFIGQLEKANEVGESTRKMLFYAGDGFKYLAAAANSFNDFDFSGTFRNLRGAGNDLVEFFKSGFNLQADFSGVTARQLGITARNARGGSNRPETGGQPTNVNALNRFLGGSDSTSSKKKKSGKSDEEKEAEALQKAYDRQNESLAEQIALFGQTGEAAKLRYELEHGELSKLTDAEKQILIVKAERLDQMDLEKELGDAANKRLMEESELVSQGVKETDQLISDMELELDLIGKTNAEREKAIALRGLDANATEAQREQVAGLVEELHRAEELQGFIDDFKTGLADAFVDFASGAKSAKEAFGDFADELFKRALQFVADKAIQAMFEAFSGGTTGGAQGGWGNFFSSLMSSFGGGRAGGGGVLPGMFYEVNESGMEMATVDGRDYLLTGSKSGNITPASRMGSVYNLNNTFIVPPGQRQRTQEQQAQKMGQQVEEITRRNS